MEQKFIDEIMKLIDSKREDDYWDFKEKHHSNRADLLHDIICILDSHRLITRPAVPRRVCNKALFASLTLHRFADHGPDS